MAVAVICLLGLTVIGARPWQTEDTFWFELSALLEAALAGALLIVLWSS